MDNIFIKRQIFGLLSLLLPMMALILVTSCGKDDVVELYNGNNNNNGDDNSQQGQEIIVIVDAKGNADGVHSFTRIDKTSFYIDALKYTATEGNLSVSRYDPVFFTGAAKPFLGRENGRYYSFCGRQRCFHDRDYRPSLWLYGYHCQTLPSETCRVWLSESPWRQQEPHI